MPESQVPVVVAVAVGGGAGAIARHAAEVAWPTPAGDFPWTILAVNATGSALIGVLLVLITEARTAHRLLRPLLGTGFLGGFTTFSTFAVQTRTLLDGQADVAAAYVGGTVLSVLLAVWIAATGTRLLILRRHT
jgi:fluoride exporter